MGHEADVHHRASVAKLAYIFPLGSLLAVIISGSIMVSTGVSSAQVGLVLSGLGVGLAIAYFALSLVRARARHGGRTALSLVIAVLLMIFGAGSFLLEYVLADFASSLSDTTLSTELQNAATQAGVPAGTFLVTGKSGELVSSNWTNPNGGEIVIGISWTKNADGLLITASPVGPVPKGQDGSPRTQQVLHNGMLGFPLNYFTIEAKNSQFHIFDDWLSMFNEMVDGSASPVIKHAKEHGGQLPTAAEADALLSQAKKVFEFDYKVGSDDDTPAKVKFVIERYTYQPGKDGMFTIQYAWSCDYKMGSSMKSKSASTGSEKPVTGVITIDFAASGHIAMAMKDGQLQNPLYEVLGAYNKRSNEEEEAAQRRKKTPAGSATGS
ncbi:MAG: hypothetical protein P8M32_09445 [Phycisphaerales bacterium]|nr:hypothetical protein [Phycisphaerales bacterium]